MIYFSICVPESILELSVVLSSLDFCVSADCERSLHIFLLQIRPPWKVILAHKSILFCRVLVLWKVSWSDLTLFLKVRKIQPAILWGGSGSFEVTSDLIMWNLGIWCVWYFRVATTFVFKLTVSFPVYYKSFYGYVRPREAVDDSVCATGLGMIALQRQV